MGSRAQRRRDAGSGGAGAKEHVGWAGVTPQRVGETAHERQPGVVTPEDAALRVGELVGGGIDEVLARTVPKLTALRLPDTLKSE